MLERIGALGLSAEGFAKLVRVERGRTVRQWEAGERDIPGPVVILVEAIHASSAVRKCCSAWGRDANRRSNQLRFINIAGSKRRAYSQHFACDALGTVALLAACVQHWRYIRRLRHGQAKTPWDLTLVVASLVVCGGLLILGELLLRFSPFA